MSQSSKVIPLAEAIERFVHDGDTVYAAGFTHLIPFAAGHELIRQRKRDLTLVRATPDLIYDQLIAAGCARKVVFSWAGNPGVGSLRVFRKAVQSKQIEVEEYTHFGMVMALTAGASRLPFMPLMTNIGSDLPAANPRIKEITCPYTGQILSTVPAINPDVAIIHAQRASISGDVQVWGIGGEQKEAAFASRKVIVTVEEIVGEDTVRHSPQLTVVPGFKVASVSLVPFGAHPSYAHGYYDRDNDFYVDWDRISADDNTLTQYLDEWVYGVKDRGAILEQTFLRVKSPVGNKRPTSAGLNSLVEKPKHALLVYNPVARGSSEPDHWLGPVVHRLCAESDWMITIRATTPGLTGHELLESVPGPLDLVIAAGGDGTIQSVVAALAATGSQVPLGLVPVGTGNQFARNLGIYTDNLLEDSLDRAIDTILKGVPLRVDLGIMNGHYFTVAAGAGPISDAVIIPGRDDKTNWKMLAYASSMIQTFAMPPVVFNVIADGEHFQIAASGIFVSNVADLGVGSISDTANLVDGVLDLCILNPQHFTDYLELGFGFAGGFVGGEAPYYIRKVKKVDVEVSRVRTTLSPFQQLSHRLRSWWRGRPYQAPPWRSEVTAMIDGDACGTTPMHIEVAPQAVSVLVPPSSNGDS